MAIVTNRWHVVEQRGHSFEKWRGGGRKRQMTRVWLNISTSLLSDPSSHCYFLPLWKGAAANQWNWQEDNSSHCFRGAIRIFYYQDEIISGPRVKGHCLMEIELMLVTPFFTFIKITGISLLQVISDIQMTFLHWSSDVRKPHPTLPFTAEARLSSHRHRPGRWSGRYSLKRRCINEQGLNLSRFECALDN